MAQVKELVRTGTKVGLSKTALAALVGTSRQSLYAWLDGQPLRAENGVKVRVWLERLTVIANNPRLIERLADLPHITPAAVKELIEVKE